jgi:hypothetical protein
VSLLSSPRLPLKAWLEARPLRPQGSLARENGHPNDSRCRMGSDAARGAKHQGRSSGRADPRAAATPRSPCRRTRLCFAARRPRGTSASRLCCASRTSWPEARQLRRKEYRPSSRPWSVPSMPQRATAHYASGSRERVEFSGAKARGSPGTKTCSTSSKASYPDVENSQRSKTSCAGASSCPGLALRHRGARGEAERPLPRRKTPLQRSGGKRRRLS